MDTYGPRDIYDQLWTTKGPTERQIEGGYDAWRARMLGGDGGVAGRACSAGGSGVAAELDAIVADIHMWCRQPKDSTVPLALSTLDALAYRLQAISAQMKGR